MAFGLIIIGDEILSGKREDKHFPQLLKILGTRGLALSWVQYLADDPARITATLRQTLAGDDVVFSTGGIGATPDDHTRQCVAAALNQPLVLHPEARECIRGRIAEMVQQKGEVLDYDREDNQQRLKMGEFPQGADIIPNSYNRIPGFSVANLSGKGRHYFAPGFPVMAWPMFEWVLDSFYADLFHRDTITEKSIFVYHAMESRLTPLMESLERDYSGVRVFSLPSVGEDGHRPHIELGVKGRADLVEAAFAVLVATVQKMGSEYTLSLGSGT